MMRPTSGNGVSLATALRVTEHLATKIGPRRPCGAAEAEAAAFVADELAAMGAEQRTEPIAANSTFGVPWAVICGVALSAGAVPRRRRFLRSAVAASAAILAAMEAEFHPASPMKLLARGASRNVIGVLEPAAEAKRTLCLVSHLDSSRSGLMFHPKVTPHLSPLVAAVGVGITVQGLEGVVGRSRLGRRITGAGRLLTLIGAAFTAERELRGVDVPGANDNASGVGACIALGAEVAAAPLENTRLILLVTGSEESGVFGARSFIESHTTEEWLFLNFDGVGAPAALHYLEREGGPLRSWPADAGLASVAEGVISRRPDLGFSGTARSSGLPYDSTPILARGGRAITLTVQNGSIPNYHWPTDTTDRIDRDVFERALGAGREMIAAIDRGEADR